MREKGLLHLKVMYENSASNRKTDFVHFRMERGAFWESNEEMKGLTEATSKSLRAQTFMSKRVIISNWELYHRTHG